MKGGGLRIGWDLEGLAGQRHNLTSAALYTNLPSHQTCMYSTCILTPTHSHTPHDNSHMLQDIRITSSFTPRIKGSHLGSRGLIRVRVRVG